MKYMNIYKSEMPEWRALPTTIDNNNERCKNNSNDDDNDNNQFLI